MNAFQNIWDFLESIDILIGLGTFVFSALVYINLRRKKSRVNRLAETSASLFTYTDRVAYQEAIRTERPMALCLSLTEQDLSVKKAVRDFLLAQKKKMPIVEIQSQGLSKETLPDFISDLRKKRQHELAAATEIHLFINGPVVAAALAGAALVSFGAVKLYQYNSKYNTYEYWGLLER